MSLSYIGQQITLYATCFIVIAGIIGNGINVFIFSSVRSYRATPCTFYFLIASICNILYIAIIPVSRIVMTGYGIDLTQTSMSWCKMRLFCGSVLSLTSLSCTCLATIDQFFVTSQNARLRHFSNIKWAHRIAVIIPIVWILHGIPILLFYNISPVTKSCIDVNYVYSIYWSIYIISYFGIVPVLVMSVFGYLTYCNIHQTQVLAGQQADRQLTKMILVEVALVVIAFIPYGSNNAYSLITSSITKDADRLEKDTFVTFLFNVICYIYFIGSCYMFLISSSRFRRAIKSQIFRHSRLNNVTPAQIPAGGTVILQKRTRNRSKT